MNPHARSFSGNHVSLFGLGIEGQSIVTFLLRENVSSVTVYDEKLDANTLEQKISQFKDKRLKGIAGTFPKAVTSQVLFRSPGLRPDLSVFVEARTRHALVTSSTNVFFARCPGTIIGVTGTKGKGTTSALITEMLKAEGKDVYLGGNIGTAPLDFLPQLSKDSWVVFELSSFQLWDIDASPHIGVVVMVTVDHLDVHVDSREYEWAKSQMLRYQTTDDYCVINWDYPNGRKMAQEGEGIVFRTSANQEYKPGAYVKGKQLLYADGVQEETICTIDAISIPGPHNIQNALSAITAAKIVGCTNNTVVKALSSFKGLPHRLEFIAEKNEAMYYNDSFSTTPETTIAAIRSFSEPKIIIIGGSFKGSDFSELGEVINASQSIKAIIGIGEEWSRIKKYIHNSRILIKEGCTSMNEIISTAYAVSKKGDVVLLSPGCASFDMFESYKQRGNQFRELVRQL